MSDSLYGRAVLLMREAGVYPEQSGVEWLGTNNAAGYILSEHVVTTPEAIAALEASGKRIYRAKNPDNLCFCGLDLVIDHTIPRDEIHLKRNGAEIGKITGIGA